MIAFVFLSTMAVPPDFTILNLTGKFQLVIATSAVN